MQIQSKTRTRNDNNIQLKRSMSSLTCHVLLSEALHAIISMINVRRACNSGDATLG